jgi:ADP-ribose pyrophosphatase YjhB (NUDIX family)
MLKKVVQTIWRNVPPSLRRRIIRVTQRKFTASVAAIVFNENGEVLLLDHIFRISSNWEIPGGFLERYEQPVDAVKRELFEETGIELYDVELIRVRTNNRHIEILFRAQTNGTASVKSREINAVRWFKADELPKKMNRRQKELIANLLKN